MEAWHVTVVLLLVNVVGAISMIAEGKPQIALWSLTAAAMCWWALPPAVDAKKAKKQP